MNTRSPSGSFFAPFGPWYFATINEANIMINIHATTITEILGSISGMATQGAIAAPTFLEVVPITRTIFSPRFSPKASQKGKVAVRREKITSDNIPKLPAELIIPGPNRISRSIASTIVAKPVTFLRTGSILAAMVFE